MPFDEKPMTIGEIRTQAGEYGTTWRGFDADGRAIELRHHRQQLTLSLEERPILTTLVARARALDLEAACDLAGLQMRQERGSMEGRHPAKPDGSVPGRMRMS